MDTEVRTGMGRGWWWVSSDRGRHVRGEEVSVSV